MTLTINLTCHKLNKKLTSIIVLGMLMISCSSPEKTGSQYSEYLKTGGIILSGNLDEPVNELFFGKYDGLTNAEFLAGYSPQPEEERQITELSVIVDMSAGMNIGIDKSYEAMSSLVTNLDPGNANVTYFHADDSETLEELDLIQSISDGVKLQNPANFRRQFSKLRPALAHATSNSDRASVVVTDFLLDEGDRSTERRFKNGQYISGETADNTTWAKDYFTSWFLDGNKLLIYSIEYDAVNYYNREETKRVFYLVFVPKNSSNRDVENLLSDFDSIFEDRHEYDPLDIELDLELDDITECNEAYPSIKNPFNESHQTELESAYHITFSHEGLREQNSPIVAACDVELENSSPFQVTLEAKTIDATNDYQTAISKEKESIGEWGNRFEAHPLEDDVELALAEEDFQLQFTDDVTRVNYMAGVSIDKLLATGLFATNYRVKKISDDLVWDFESKYGTLENSALKESLRLGLEQYVSSHEETHLNTIFFSIHP